MGMLILSRKAGERIAIEHGGEVCYLEVLTNKGSVTRLGFEAGNNFTFVREELVEEAAQKREAEE